MDLREYRKRVGATLEDVAAEVGVAPSTLSRIERGAVPKADLALRLLRWADEAGRAARVARGKRLRLCDLAGDDPATAA